MQWVVTTGPTVDAARERALDALGIDESDLEFEVLAEAGTSLFGLRTTDARIRARVRPTRPRPKVDRRMRRKGRGKTSGKGKGKGRSGRGRRPERAPDDGSEATDEESRSATAEATDPAANTGRGRRASGPSRRGRTDRDAPAADVDDAAASATPTVAEDAPAKVSESPTTNKPAKTKKSPDGDTGADMSDISISEQEPTATDFVRGLVEAFGFDATVESQEVDEETVEIDVTGEDLGLLVGPRGNTLTAIQELARTAVAQQHSGRLEGRLRVDVAGYRAKRKVALTRFTQQQAERVKETGESVALEPMSPPDRKTVHDAVNDIDGVHTSSRGEDRRRHVVLHADD